MNIETQSEKSEIRRSKRERYVWEALNAVQKWRDLFENGYLDEVGNYLKPSLKEAADLVGLPKRTLEQYHSVFKKLPQSIDIMRILDKKMGYLNQLIKEFKNEPAVTQEQQEEIQQEQSSWDNMIIEADDQLAVQRDPDEDQVINQVVQQQQIFENEEDYVKYLQFEEDENYCQEYYQFNEDEDFLWDQEQANPAVPDF
ncbi:unnamed protein product (macronuclear) [Paramecium tetraurelia]|uniref:HRDC domain-containing protein n=1 Tax=Paramecium tetraurelia TaxID=5888 RepID=A0D554_PARTE|nr:uncharacterized protein GSPATT00013618001 [Paramecium tetraurelia]CAK78171.1 unnamed protein product [Paramecium tetraurelia]|eukprot:XP_001445568.1 hypothetical protein (macronuclear) [Paramecium tetraurelia strain d4-2]